VWSNAHWEQPCTVEGWVEVGGRRTEVTGSGIRDHARGSRDFTHMGPHFWLNGMTQSQRAFGLLHIEPTAGQPRPLSTAYMVRDSRLVEAQVVSLPADPTFVEPFEIALVGPDGKERIRGQLLHEMPFTVQYPNEVLFGYRVGKPQHMLREGQLRWERDGEIAHGLGERTVTLAADGSRKPADGVYVWTRWIASSHFGARPIDRARIASHTRVAMTVAQVVSPLVVLLVIVRYVLVPLRRTRPPDGPRVCVARFPRRPRRLPGDADRAVTVAAGEQAGAGLVALDNLCSASWRKHR
jgi:hypothetical protein